MKTSPPIEKIKEWLAKENPLNLFEDNFSIKDIDPKAWSGHFDYLVETPKKKFVLRFKGPEWGKTNGVIDEYKTLKKIEQYEVGPKVYFLTENFFGEPMIFEEYLEGKLLGDFSEDEQKNYFSEVAKFIYKINSISFQKDDFPFQEPMTSYTKSKNAWKTRIEFILDCKETKTCGQELLTFLPGIESILNKFEDRLQKVLKQVDNSFVFESSHLGHCLKTSAGFRFFNWEQVSYGDPSYTLAVFLTSLHERPDFEEVKKTMIESYLAQKHIPEFAELVEQRITERHISNIIYGAYMSVKKETKIVSDWYEKVKQIEQIVKDHS
ncbi:MAG: phosphotransferase [Candidatus Yonathbacteria bacterium]|nr:phosphotransferase [Candidatus Yonathbacteria bacterium]